MSNELKPCPFCNCTDIGEVTVNPALEYRHRRFKVYCKGCQVRTSDQLTKKSARQQWNTRTQAQPADALVEALKEVTASLEWNAHGICRGINDGPIMPSSMAVERAKEALATYRAAQDGK